MNDSDDDDGSSVDQELLQVCVKLEDDALKQKREQEEEAADGINEAPIDRRCPETNDMDAPLTGKIINVGVALETADSSGSDSEEEQQSSRVASGKKDTNTSGPPKPSQPSETSPFFTNAFKTKALDEDMLDSSDDSAFEEEEVVVRPDSTTPPPPQSDPSSPSEGASAKDTDDRSTSSSSSSGSECSSSSSNDSDSTTSSNDAPSPPKDDSKDNYQIPKVIQATGNASTQSMNEIIDLTGPEPTTANTPRTPKPSEPNGTEKKKISRDNRSLSTFDSDSIGDLDLMPVAFSRRSNNISEEKVAPKPPETNTSADDASKRTDGSSSSSISDAPDLLPKVTQATQEPSSSLDIQDYVPDSHNDVHTEIDCSLIAHPPYQQRPPPRLRDFNAQTSPRQHRQKVGVSQWFNPPISRLWSNKFEEFNHFQSEMSHVMCGSDDNVVVSAPTGAGKSTIFEMAMARFFAMNLQAEMQHPGQFNTMSKARKILYIAPSKALCEERYDDWSRRLRAMGLGIEVALVTGDAIDPGTSFSELISAHFVITTPEKWDAMTRRWTENFYLMASIKLLLVDEVHFLCDENRGWCLETVVTRMKTVHRIARSLNVTREELKSSSYPATNPEAIRSNFRMIAVSATLPNMEEFADFFMANEAYAFDESYRPVPLEKHVLAMGTVGKNDYTFWSNLKQQVPAVLQRFRQNRQCLIFCHSKKDAEYIANDLIQKRSFGNRNASSRAQKGSTQYYIDMGVGYHHSGVEKEDRNQLEQAFASGQIKCLACTSTLAQGVNTPAGLVLIVGTRAYRGNGYEEVDISQLLQMIGRAGRPGQDDSGTAVILTDKDSVQRVQRKLNSGFGAAKSKLVSHLPESMNSAISNGVIRSLEDSFHWFRTTFLFSCMNRSARTDSIPEAAKLCEEAVHRLKRIELVRLDQEIIYPQPACHVMNKHMLSLQTISAIVSWPSNATECQILRSLSTLENLQTPVKRDQKKELKEIHKTDVIRYKCVVKQLSKFTVKDESQKAFILLQAIISQHEFKDKLLKQQMSSITNSATAILSAAQEYCFKTTKFSTVAKICFQLHRSLMVCLWDINGGALNQIDGIGLTAVRMLRFQGIHSFQHVLDSTEETIEKAAGRPFPFGRDLKQTVQGFMRDNLKLSAKIEYTRESNAPAGLVVSLKDPEDAQSAMTPKDKESSISFTIMASIDGPHGTLLMVKENVVAPSSYRVVLPPDVQNVAVIKLASIVGFDESIMLETGNDAPRGSKENDAQQTPTGRFFPRFECTERQGQTQKRKTRQLEISFETQKKTKSSTNSTKLDPSPTITPPRNDSERSQREVVNDRGLRQDTCNTSNREQERHFPSNNLEASPFAAAVRQRHAPVFRPTNVTPQVTRIDQRMHITGVPGVNQSTARTPARITTIQHPFRSEQRPAESISKFWSSQHDNRHAAAETPSVKELTREWKKTQYKDSQSQKRAYTHKKENPFNDFRHDPNATEEVLTHLSRKSSSKPFKRVRDLRRDRQRTRMDLREVMHEYAEAMEEERHGQAKRYAPLYTPPKQYDFGNQQREHSLPRGPPLFAPPPPPPPPARVSYPAQYPESYAAKSDPFSFSNHLQAPSHGGWESFRGGHGSASVMRQPPPSTAGRSYGSFMAPMYNSSQLIGYQENYPPPSRYRGQSFAGDTQTHGGYTHYYEQSIARPTEPPPEIEFPAAHHHSDPYSFQNDGFQDTRAVAPQRYPSQFESTHDHFDDDLF